MPSILRSKTLQILSAGLLASCYQFDKAVPPPYPVLLPPPQNITFGNGSAVIDPCYFAVNTTINPEASALNQTI